MVASKAVVLIDGNQPGLGKTWLARIIGILLDGIDPQLIHFTPDDEELAKRICATLRGGPQSVLLIDNAKVRGGGAISSPVLEANSMAPQISLRILGQSANYTRPNDLLWVLTMNDTKTSARPGVARAADPVLLRRRPPPPRLRGPRPDRATPASIAPRSWASWSGWSSAGTSSGGPRGRRSTAAATGREVVGGILQTAGLPEFLANLDEAAAAFNQALDQLAALAEAVAAAGDPALVTILNDPEGGES